MPDIAKVTLQQAVAALGALYERHAKTQRWIVQYSLIALANEARLALPQVATLRFDWSDQGPFLDVHSFLDADNMDLDEDHEVDINASVYAWNLGEDNRCVWEEHMVRTSGVSGLLFCLNVDEALAIRPFQKEE